MLTDTDTERSLRFVFDIKKLRKDLGYSPRSFNIGPRAFIKEVNIEMQIMKMPLTGGAGFIESYLCHEFTK